MTQQPTALRLADLLEAIGCKWEAAELRRLHAANAELLEALEALVSDEDARSWGVFGVDNAAAFGKARAAIVAAKGEA